MEAERFQRRHGKEGLSECRRALVADLVAAEAELFQRRCD
jgi:hypothetical protein